MKLIPIVLSALLALAAAESTTTATASTTTTVTSEEGRCAKSCDSKDTCCIAKCYKVPCPSDSQANDTNKCVSACPQGTGSPADSKRFEDCEQSCYSSHFFPANGAAATETSHSTVSGTTVSGSRASETSNSASETGFATSTAGTKSSNNEASTTESSSTSHSSSTQTHNAASNVKMGASCAGLFGLVLAAFAL